MIQYGYAQPANASMGVEAIELENLSSQLENFSRECRVLITSYTPLEILTGGISMYPEIPQQILAATICSFINVYDPELPNANDTAEISLQNNNTVTTEQTETGQHNQ